jgi:hypothetical protein
MDTLRVVDLHNHYVAPGFAAKARVINTPLAYAGAEDVYRAPPARNALRLLRAA